MPHGTAIRDNRSGDFATSPKAKADHSEIHRLAALGRGVQTISNITGASMEDVRRILNPVANDDAPPKPKPVKVERGRSAREAVFTMMWNDGWPKTDIAAALNIHLITVDKMRDRLDLVKRQPSRKSTDWTDEQAEYVRQKYIVEKLSATEVAKHVGRTRGAVRGFARRQGWARYRIGERG